jgi:GntR family transcriptional regulator
MNLSRKDRPLYLQIKNILKERILYGVYPLGSNIPSEPQLEQEFAVSKITVRGAIQELVQEGYLEKGSGKGTKVIRNKAAAKWSKWKHFTEILVEENHQIRKEWLRAGTVRNEVGSELHGMFGERCLKLERAYYLDGQPYIFYEHYVKCPRKEPELEDFRDHSLYDVLEEWGISLDKLRDEFAVSLPPDEAKRFLQLADGVPVLKRSRYSRDVLGSLAEYSVGYYNTELQNYIVDYDA